MDIREIRRQNLAELRKQEGSVRALADRVDTDPNYLSQILGRKGNMGHAMARRFEDAFGKPEGWMDQLHDFEAQKEEQIIRIVKLARRMSPSQVEGLEMFVNTMLSSDSNPSPSPSPSPNPNPSPSLPPVRRRRASQRMEMAG